MKNPAHISSAAMAIALILMCACREDPPKESKKDGSAIPDSVIAEVTSGAQDSLDEFSFLDSEAIGFLEEGVPQDTVLARLGRPDSLGEDVLWGETGTYVQKWRYTSRGIVLEMESPDSGTSKIVLGITAVAPCSFATARGIGIGATESDVAALYGAVQDKESSEPGRMFVAGSIYGGLVFTFEDSRVSRIFLGAASE
jgi:hypothetical protein